MWRLPLVHLRAWPQCDNTTVLLYFSIQFHQRRTESLIQYYDKLPHFVFSPEEHKRSVSYQFVCHIGRPMFPMPNVRTDVVEVSHVLTEGPVTRLVTSEANDSRAHAVHTLREDFAKLVS